MSAFPSPLKSPTWTSTQVTPALHVSHKVALKLEPVESPVDHWPVDSARPVMSAFPSPLKSPTLTSTQLTLVSQVPQLEDTNELPVESPTHHWPPYWEVLDTCPAMSIRPSPLKSPTSRTSQVTEVLHVAHRPGMFTERLGTASEKKDASEAAMCQLP